MPGDTSEGSGDEKEDTGGPNLGSVADGVDKYINPDAAKESDSEYDGLLSYAKEWHAAIIGATAGVVGRITKGTEHEPIGVAVMSTVTGLAFGLEAYSKYKNNPISNNVRAEPWYAMGCMLAAYDGENIAEYLPVDEVRLGALTKTI